MKIGDLKLKVGAPDAERLLSLTGCSVDAMRATLESPCICSTVAGALLACAPADAPERHDLARMIAAAGVDSVRTEVLALYQPVEQVPDAEIEE